MMSDQSNPQDAVPTSALAEQLKQDGAHAQTVDVEAMLRQMAAMQAQIDALNRERGIPTDPVAAAKQDLLDHLKARAAQYPNNDFSELINEVANLGETVTSDGASLVHTLVTEKLDELPHHELAYLKVLSSSLLKHVLKAVPRIVSLA